VVTIGDETDFSESAKSRNLAVDAAFRFHCIDPRQFEDIE
jgi:hypothetical protein